MYFDVGGYAGRIYCIKDKINCLAHITDGDYSEVVHSLRFHDMPLEDCYKKIRKEQSMLSLRRKNLKNVRPRKFGVEERIPAANKIVTLTKYIGENGYMQVPPEVWRKLQREERKEVMNHNDDIRKKRAAMGNKGRDERNGRDDRNSGRNDRYRGRDDGRDNRETKRIRRTVMDILQEASDSTKEEQHADPETADEQNSRNVIIPKFTFRIKKT